MKYFCVIGEPIEHSLSPVMHNAVFKKHKLECKYFAFRVKKEELENAVRGLKALGFKGFNVTIPHKEKIIEYIDELSKEARLIKAVNTVKIDKKLIGYNTDGIGAVKSLKSLGEVKDKKIIILGAGGAARAISFSLALEKAREIIIANRTLEKAKKLAKEVEEKTGVKTHACSIEKKVLKEKIKESEILINCTSVGMYPDIFSTLVEKDMLKSDLVVMDIVYNPLETRLLKEAKKAGAKIINGVEMLVYQGAEALKIWGVEPDIELMRQAVLKELKQ